VGDQGEAATRGGGQNPTLATQHNAHAPVWAYASPDQANWNVTRSEAVGPRWRERGPDSRRVCARS